MSDVVLFVGLLVIYSMVIIAFVYFVVKNGGGDL